MVNGFRYFYHAEDPNEMLKALAAFFQERMRHTGAPEGLADERPLPVAAEVTLHVGNHCGGQEVAECAGVARNVLHMAMALA